MSMAQVIRAAMKKQGVTVSQLSRQLGCTTQNISGKMRRDNFRESELQEIAAAIGCRFEGRFISEDSGKPVEAAACQPHRTHAPCRNSCSALPPNHPE